jgi:sugar lactone lactonase YvrE
MWWWALACGDGERGRPGSPTDGVPEVLVSLVTGVVPTGAADGAAAAARFTGVTALCREGGTLYAADTFGGTIRAVDLVTGAVTTLAGAAHAFGAVDGVGAEARFRSPRGLACLPGALIVADEGAFRRVSTEDGATTTFSGFPGAPGFADGPAGEARIGYLVHAAVWDVERRFVWFADRSNDAVRTVDPDSGAVVTVATGFDGPGGLAFGEDGRLYVADTFTHTVAALDPETGLVETLAGVAGVAGVDDGAPGSLDTPQGLAPAPDGFVVVDFGGRVARWRDGALATVPTRGLTGTFSSPAALDDGYAYEDLSWNALRTFDLDGRVGHLAGPVEPYGTADGDVSEARFGTIYGLSAAADGHLYASDSDHGTVREVRDGRVSTLASGFAYPLGSWLDGGTLYVADAGAGAVVAVDTATGETRLVTDALGEPWAVAGLADGRLVVADAGAHALVAVDPGTGAVSALAGTGRAGAEDGPAAEASFRTPSSVWVDGDRVFVTDVDAGTLRELDLATGRVRTIAGRDGAWEVVDGPARQARFVGPTSVVGAPDGALLVSDGWAHVVRRVDLDAEEVTSWLGTVDAPGAPVAGAPVPLASGRVAYPDALAMVDGVVFVASEAAVLRVGP